jgi:(2Fe-2S) ferredoxin
MALNALRRRLLGAGPRHESPAASEVPDFCLGDDRRPCISLCVSTPTCTCGCEEVRQAIEEEIALRGLAVSLGTMKFGCDGNCPYGPIVGFPRKGFFYIHVSPERAREVVAETLEKGHILFDLLHLDPLKTTAGSVLYDRASGLIATIDDAFCMVRVARYFLEFDEGISCGKCAPCRIGSVELIEILDRIIKGEGQPGDLERMDLVCRAMQEGPYCDFARSSSGPVVAIVRHFRSEFEKHIEQKGCQPGVCPEIGIKEKDSGT